MSDPNDHPEKHEHHIHEKKQVASCEPKNCRRRGSPVKGAQKPFMGFGLCKKILGGSCRPGGTNYNAKVLIDGPRPHRN